MDEELASCYKQFLQDLGQDRLSYRGPAGELRSVVELLLDRLAPDEEARKAGFKPDRNTKRVTYADRARCVLRQHRAEGPDALQATNKCAESISRIEEGVGNILRGLHKRSSIAVHEGEEREELVRIHGYFKAVIRDLLL